MNKKVKIEDALGLPLAHDITEIRRGEFKGRAFKRGHRLRESDICHLQRLGKRHLNILDIPPGFLHEDDAAQILAKAFCGPGIAPKGEPREGKVELIATVGGLLKVQVDALIRVNMLGDLMCASRHGDFPVERGQLVAATRAIPLVISEQAVNQAVEISLQAGGLFRTLPMRRARAGLIITGNEVFTRLIDDQFEPVLRRKLSALGCSVSAATFVPDDAEVIADAVSQHLSNGADLILTTGGMSVDADDVTRQGIIRAGAQEFVYGSAVLPGAMFMVTRIGEVPVVGVPACGLYHEITILDLMLPRILAGERITRRDLARLAHGGLCLQCETCRFPVCPFGKTGI